MRDLLISVSVKREFKKLLFLTRDLKVLREPWRSWIINDIRDFTTLFYVILRRESSEWLESSIQNDLGIPFAIGSLDLAIRAQFSFFKHCVYCKKRLLK